MKNRARLGIESLEQRLAMTADVTAVLAGGVLTITGSGGDDTVTVERNGAQIRVVEADKSFQFTKVKSIAIDLDEGNDVVKLRSIVSKAPWNGAPITITSADENDKLQMSDGSKYYFGHTQDLVTVSKDGKVKINGAKPDWWASYVPMNDIGIKARDLAVDKVLDYEDMLEIFNKAEDHDTIDEEDFQALRAIGNNKSLYKGVEYVQCLAGYVVNPCVANVIYRGVSMGNLEAGSSSSQLEQLVNKWFKGKDTPATPGVVAEYQAIDGNLWDGDPNYTQVQQGFDGDCYLLGTLNAIAVNHPDAIEDMFVYQNADADVWVVRFFDKGKAKYLTVNNELPIYVNGGDFIYDAPLIPQGGTEYVLWAALIEKAYCQLAELGWSHPNIKANSYTAITAGNWPSLAMEQLLGGKAGKYDISSAKESDVIKAWNAERPIALSTYNSPPDHRIVGGHNYALIGYDAQTGLFEVANPWGATDPNKPATLELDWETIQANYALWYLGPKL